MKLLKLNEWTVAADPNGDSGPMGNSEFVTSDPGSLLGTIVWIIVALAIVIALMIFVIKWLSNSNRKWGMNRSIRILGGAALAQNSTMQVVELAGRIYVIGTGQTVTLLDKIDDPDQVAQMIAAFEKQAASGFNPAKLSEFLQNRKNAGKQASNRELVNEEKKDEDKARFESLLQNQLNQRNLRNEELKKMIHGSKSNERLMDNEK